MIAQELLAAYYQPSLVTRDDRWRSYSVAVLAKVLETDYLTDAVRDQIQSGLEAWSTQPPDAETIDAVGVWLHDYMERKNGSWNDLIDREDSMIRAAAGSLLVDHPDIDIEDDAQWAEDYILCQVEPSWSESSRQPLFVKDDATGEIRAELRPPPNA